jgi:putative acetyltransferase
MTNSTVRIMVQADKPAVADLNTRAFGRTDEADIVTKLEKAGDVLLQLVAEMDGRIVGHILFYPMGVFGKLGAAGLGPMCVDPWVQKEGIGSQLVRAGLGMMNQSGVPIVFVLGHDTYYPRFGFSVEAAADFETPLKGPHFMAVRLRFGPPMSGRLIFPDAFGVPIA